MGNTTSSAEQLADAIPGASTVKAFNTIGSHRFVHPQFGDESASMFVAGDDEGAKKVALDLAAGLGFEPVDVGPLSESRLLEPLALLWIRMTYVHGAGSIGFRMIED